MTDTMIELDGVSKRFEKKLDIAEKIYNMIGGDLQEERVLQAGELLFREGDPGTEAFQILEGALAMTVAGPSGPIEIARRGVRDIVGEMAVVLDASRSATATAIEPSRVAVVTGEVISRAMKSANPLLAHMISSLSARLREEVARVKQ